MPDLNTLLRTNQLDLKEDDQADFEVFLAKLQQKRKQTDPIDAPDLDSRGKKMTYDDDFEYSAQSNPRIASMHKKEEEKPEMSGRDDLGSARGATRNQDAQNNPAAAQESSDDDNGAMTKAQK